VGYDQKNIWEWPRSRSDFSCHSLFALLGGCGIAALKHPRRLTQKKTEKKGQATFSVRKRTVSTRGQYIRKSNLSPLFSRSDSGRLNLQWSLHPSPNIFF